MRLGLLINDIEYRNALVEKLSSYDNDIFVNVIGKSGECYPDCLILTDIDPESVDDQVLSKIRNRTVFLTSSIESLSVKSKDFHNGSRNCHKVFKYSSVNEIITELSLIYNDWHGSVCIRNQSAKVIVVCSESDSFSADKCLSLSRQIIYRRGGSVLLVGLGFINDYGSNESSEINMFARLIYAVRKGRESVSDSFTYTDSYGVSALMLPPGQNPMAYLGEDELRTLIYGLATRFDTIVLDVGTCFRKENISIIREAENIVFFESGRREIHLSGIIGKEASKKLITIKLTGETDEALAMDDCIRKIYGKGDYDDLKS